MQETEPDPGRPTYGALFFDLVPEAALVLGLDVGARFLRGAICDLRGDVRARQDVELDGADADAAIEAIGVLRDSLAESCGLSAELIDGAVVGVPGVVDADTGQLRLATNVPGLEGRHWGDDIRDRLGLPVAVENDINLAAVGERWQGVARGVEDFVFLSVGTGLGAGLILRGELHRGRHGAAGEVDLVAAGRTRRDRSVRGRSLRARGAARRPRTAPRQPSSRRSTSAASLRPRAPATRSRRRSSTRRRAGSRFIWHRSRRSRTSRSSSSAAASGPTQTSSSARPGISSPAGYRIRLASRSRASATQPFSPARSPSGCVPRSTTPSRTAAARRLSSALNAPLSRGLIALAALAAAAAFSGSASAAAPPKVLVAEFENDVNPVTQEYLLDAIHRGEEEGFEAVVIEMDTPGGLGSSMRAIVKGILAAKIPVIVYVAPSGRQRRLRRRRHRHVRRRARDGAADEHRLLDPDLDRRRGHLEGPAAQGRERRGRVHRRARPRARPQRRRSRGGWSRSRRTSAPARRWRRT